MLFTTYCLNISKAISVVALISSPVAVANTRATEIAHVAISPNFNVEAKSSSELLSAINTSSNILVMNNALDLPIPKTEMGRKLLEHEEKYCLVE